MRTLSRRIFRTLFCQHSLGLAFKNNFNRTNNLRWNSQIVPTKLVDKKKFEIQTEEAPCPEKIITKIKNLLTEYSSPDSIKWEEINQKLSESNMPFFGSYILQACANLRDLEAGISYYNYVLKSGRALLPLEIIGLIKLFTIRVNDISKYEKVVKHVYESAKEYMNSPLVQDYLINLITRVPSCYYDFLENFGDKIQFMSGKNKIALKALELNNVEMAYEIMSSSPIKEGAFEHFLSYFCDRAREHKFSPDMITKFIEFYESKNFIINHKNFVFLLVKLVETLNTYDKDYEWVFKNCSISSSSVCSNCNQKLVDKCISESEFNSLKDIFLSENGLTDKAVFLNSTDKEIKKFFKFLETVKPYDIVFDVLNLFYVRKDSKCGDLSRYLSYFLDKGFRVLLIGRAHIYKHVLRIPCLKKNQYKNKCQFFFTENLSDDDLFLLYSTLHGGLGTVLISGDHLNRYGARFKEPFSTLFFKWKLYHQYIIHKMNLYPPQPSLGLSQLTSDENGKKFTWHISYFPEDCNDTPINRKTSLKWICLQATKKDVN